jgi:hypothetical protein
MEIFRITEPEGAESFRRVEITPNGIKLLAAFAAAFSRGGAMHYPYLLNLNLLRDVLAETEEEIEFRASEELEQLRSGEAISVPQGEAPDA